MEIVKDNTLTKFVTYKDFIKKQYDKEGNPVFKQSNTRLAGYLSRSVGIAISNGRVIVASIIDHKDRNNDKAAKVMLRNKLVSVVDNDYDIVDSNNQLIQGVTQVPFEFLDLLWRDKDTYHNINGLIDPTYCNMSLNSINND